jgi:hypothetical protein
MSNIPIQIRIPDKDCAALDEWRRSQANPPTRPEAIRQLLRKALPLGDRQYADAPAGAA